jgi:hypothetical protein
MATATVTAQPSAEQLLARIAELEAQVARKTPSGSIKTAKSGGVSYYGLGRWPVTLYVSQWRALAEKMAEILAYCEAHASELSTGKDDPRFQK